MAFRFPEEWSNTYKAQFERNIGIVSIREQNIIKRSKVAVLGTGGIGAPLALQLAYSGIENLVLCDFERIERSNLNRQPFMEKDIGKYKIDVLGEYLVNINSNLRVEKYYEVAMSNIDRLLENVAVIALSLDDPFASILIARNARKRGISIAETWSVPYLFVWWFTKESSDYETAYELNTKEKSLSQIKDDAELLLESKQKLVTKLLKFPSVRDKYDRENNSLSMMTQGQIAPRSLAPIVWINSSFLAFEILFAGLLGIKKKCLAPHIFGFDYQEMNQFRF